MKRVIVTDSCAELNEKILSKSDIKRVPFFIDVEDKSFKGDENTDIDSLIKEMNSSKTPPKTAAPTPESFYEMAKGYDEVFFVSISSKLSTTYNNANIAKTMLEEDFEGVKAYTFDSKSAACGETQVITWIQEGFDKKLKFEEIVDYVNRKIEDLQTIFVLENLDNLIKNGRMSRVAGFIASALSIYPVCVGIDGEIDVKHKPRGIKSALKRMVDTIGELSNNFEDKKLYITHIRNKDRAEKVKELIEKRYVFKSIEIFEGTALSTTYANESGIIMAF